MVVTLLFIEGWVLVLVAVSVAVIHLRTVQRTPTLSNTLRLLRAASCFTVAISLALGLLRITDTVTTLAFLLAAIVALMIAMAAREIAEDPTIQKRRQYDH